MKGVNVNNVHFSSETVEWGTPQWIVDQVQAVLAEENARLVLDVCANAKNTKAPRFIGWPTDSTRQPWASIARNIVMAEPEVVPYFWMNPPYGNDEPPCEVRTCKKKRCQKRGHHNDRFRPGIGKFMLKAWEETEGTGVGGVALIPARTDTKWWHATCEPVLRGRVPGELVFLEGRVDFLTADGVEVDPAPFPSVLVKWSPR